MRSERLRYRRLAPADLDAFDGLVQDEHVRRYMMDGLVLPREWSAEQIRESEALFAQHGVGLWLAYDAHTDALAGFCGFKQFPGEPAPQLVYALRERFTGRGLATEMARAVIAYARAHAGFADIVTDADAVNAASLRVLAKLGFQRVGIRPGAFGDVILLRLPAGRAAGASTR